MRPILVLGTGLLLGCAPEPGDWRLGDDLTDLRFDPRTEDVGVYPDVSILDDPNNPFAEGGLDGDGHQA